MFFFFRLWLNFTNDTYFVILVFIWRCNCCDKLKKKSQIDTYICIVHTCIYCDSFSSQRSALYIGDSTHPVRWCVSDISRFHPAAPFIFLHCETPRFRRNRNRVTLRTFLTLGISNINVTKVVVLFHVAKKMYIYVAKYPSRSVNICSPPYNISCLQFPGYFTVHRESLKTIFVFSTISRRERVARWMDEWIMSW